MRANKLNIDSIWNFVIYSLSEKKKKNAITFTYNMAYIYKYDTQYNNNREKKIKVIFAVVNVTSITRADNFYKYLNKDWSKRGRGRRKDTKYILIDFIPFTHTSTHWDGLDFYSVMFSINWCTIWFCVVKINLKLCRAYCEFWRKNQWKQKK